MSVVQNPIIGKAKNKFGPAIFSTWKGINVMRTLPISVENPRTDAQVIQRNRLSLMVSIYRAVSAAVKAGFKEQAVKKSEYNAFVSDNIIAATTNPSGTSIVPNYSAMKFSKGTMATTEMNSVTGTSGSETLDLAWPTTLGPGQADSDVLYIVGINTDGEAAWKSINTGVTRSAGAASNVSLLFMESGDSLNIYTFFVSADGNKSSDSIYQPVTAS